MAPPQSQRLSWGETASVAFRVFKLPFYIAFDLLRSILLKPRPKPISTTASLGAIRYINGMHYRQIKTISGSTAAVYSGWVKRHGLPETVEGPFVDDSLLYWIGPKRTEKVVLYVHGGAFFAPLQDCSLSFWNHVREDLGKQGVDAGFAVLGYGLYPESTFPTQLRQLAVAFDHLLASGVKPSDIHLVGDSSGANLILQFLSQLLHPIEKIGPLQSIKAPLGSVYLMSPWVRFQSESVSFTSNTEDIVNQVTVTAWGKQYAEGVPDSRRPYIEPATAGPTWFSGLGFIVKQMLVSAGTDERFKDDIVAFAGVLNEKGGVDVRLELQKGGVHNDAYFDYLTTDKPSKIGSLTPIVVQWMKEQLAAG